MQTKARSFAAAIHLRLMGLPLVFFLGALLADIVFSLSQKPAFAAMSFIAVSAGIPAALLAAIFGLVRWLALPSRTRGRQIAWLYGTVSLILMLLFTLSWLFRRMGVDLAPAGFVSTLSYVGLLLGALTLWLGGEVVYGLDGGQEKYTYKEPITRKLPGYYIRHSA